MAFEWVLVAIIIIILLLIIGMLFGDFSRLKLSGQVVVSGVLTLISVQFLFVLQDSFETPPPSAPFETKVVAAIAIILFFNTLLQLLKWGIMELLVKRRHVKIPQFALDMGVMFLIATVSLLTISNIFGIELTGLLVGSTLVSAIIGLSLQSILGNLFEGVLLQVESPFSIGDWVEVAGQEAKVVKQSWRTLILLTRQNHYIRITYSDIASDKIVNFSRPTSLQAQDAFISCPDSHPPNFIKEILQKSVIGIEGVLLEPSPRSAVLGYGDTDVSYRVRYWIDDFEAREEIQDEVLTRFWYALHRAGVDMPTPMRDLNVRMMTAEHAAKESAIADKELLTILRSIPLFAKLTGRQMRQLADNSTRQMYTTNELIIRQGEMVNTLFIIKSGLVAILDQQKNGQNLFIDTMQANDFFGEMSLITGQAHRASVMAQNETEIITISKAAFDELLLADKRILELILQILDTRRERLIQRQLAERRRHQQQNPLLDMVTQATVKLTKDEPDV